MGTPAEGHRQRLRERFLAHETGALADEALLELLLCYAIPQRDVQPIAKRLVEKYGNLSSLLSVDAAVLCSEEGVKQATAVLLKLVDHIRTSPERPTASDKKKAASVSVQESLFLEPSQPATNKAEHPPAARAAPPVSKPQLKPRGVEVFSKSLLKETAEFLPLLPEAEDLDELREFVRPRFHYSSETTRSRRVNYVLKRMFPGGTPDRALMQFARLYAGQQELRDVAFHRFCQSEPLMAKAIDDFFLPAIGAGTITREALRAYLRNLFPNSRTLDDCSQAIVEALVTTGIARSDRRSVHFAYREIVLPSFAFILHSVFPEPGMYNLASIETHPAVRHMFWNSDRILPSVYELRNRGLISKVSEIDSVRQFTTKYDLAGMVNVLKEPQVRK
jgi:DNA repair protein RadC